jgi:tetratricopeptide (TPR) repeat protein
MKNLSENKPANKQYAVSFFNNVWDLLEKKDRTAEENEEMIHLAHASFLHWTKVEDHTPTNLSVGYWQLARVYAVVGLGDRALYYANQCLEVSMKHDLEPFYIAYGHEAKARALKVLQQHSEAAEEINKCKKTQEKVDNDEYKLLLTNDLLTI